MSLLTPLYIAGILAVSLPILFHLIRRAPRQRMQFSSLMFLPQSPPRFTRRSRLENLLLLFLRGLALCLIALAFARPFLRQPVQTDIGTRKEQLIAVLVDTSASMRRGDLWQQAAERVQKVLEETEPGDRVALWSFDREVRAHLSFQEWMQAPAGGRAALLADRIERLRPSWAATHLGAALTAVAEALDNYAVDVDSSAQRRILLVSDLQRGSELTAVSEFEWPEQIALQLASLRAPSATNAGIHLVARRDSQSQWGEEPTVAVRVTNATDSFRERFHVRWDTPSSPALELYVPAGKSTVVELPAPPADSPALRLVLKGDDHPFDNTTHLLPKQERIITVVYVGRDTAEDTRQLRFYLERAFPDFGSQSVQVRTEHPDELALDGYAGLGLVVLGDAVAAERIGQLRSFLEQGGTILSVLRSLDVAQSTGRLLELDRWEPVEAPVADYALLSRVELRHPVFSPFVDVRFADFTKIHFWKHRKIDVSAIPEAHVLANFDDGDPALVEVPVGQGTLLLLTAGWHPADSDLARSSKFPLLLTRVLEQSHGILDMRRHFSVGDSVLVPDSAEAPAKVRLPDHREIQLSGREFTGTSRPGVYSLLFGSDRLDFAVNLDPAESRTEPMPAEELERLGVRLTTQSNTQTMDTERKRQRQMRAIELEGQQKLWRWLILSALVVLLVETWLAGRQNSEVQALKPETLAQA